MRLAVLALAALLAACAPQPVPGSEEACRLEQITSVPLLPPEPPRTTRWTVEALLDGKPARLMLDTGATGLSISTEAATRLGLRQRADMRAATTGMGGTVYRRVFEVDRVAIGTQLREVPILAIEYTAEQRAGSGFDGILGMGVFDRNDIEIDFPARTLALYRIRFCPEGRPPWTIPFQSFRRPAGLRAAGGSRPVADIRLDGRPGIAMLDTGATTTLVDHIFATAAGAPATPPEGAPRSTARTMSENIMPMWRHRFGALELGGARIRDPQLWIGDLGHGIDVLIGLDMLSRLRLWISDGSGMVYLAAPSRP